MMGGVGFEPNQPTFNDVHMNSGKEAVTQVYIGFRSHRYDSANSQDEE